MMSIDNIVYPYVINLMIYMIGMSGLMTIPLNMIIGMGI